MIFNVIADRMPNILRIDLHVIHEVTSTQAFDGRRPDQTLATVDHWTQRQLEELSPDVAFVATNGLSVTRGLTTPDPSEAAIKRAMIRAGRRVVLLADHTKMGVDQFVQYGVLADVDRLITDSGLPQTERATLERAGLEVVVA